MAYDVYSSGVSSNHDIPSFEKEVIDRLARIETKLENVDMHEESHEKRIQALEATANQHKGVQTFITVAIGLLSGLIGAFGGRLL